MQVLWRQIKDWKPASFIVLCTTTHHARWRPDNIQCAYMCIGLVAYRTPTAIETVNKLTNSQQTDVVRQDRSTVWRQLYWLVRTFNCKGATGLVTMVTLHHVSSILTSSAKGSGPKSRIGLTVRIPRVSNSLFAKEHKRQGHLYVLWGINVALTSCRQAAATICPRPGLQRKRAAAALSQAGRAGPGPISQYAPSSQPVAHAARQPDVRDRRQTALSLNKPHCRLDSQSRSSQWQYSDLLACQNTHLAE